ncbi:MAG: hypothetical protein LRY54_01875 [Alphaproteobacteria bacterium]|nr:hypothetical protein [Alphaproteobacteria bacterium]
MINLIAQFALAGKGKELAMTSAQLASGVAARFDGLAASAPAPGMDATPGGMA